MILAIQNIKAISGGKGGKLARWTIGWYLGTTVIAIVHSCLLTGLVWGPMVRSFHHIPRPMPANILSAARSYFLSPATNNLALDAKHCRP